MSGEMSDAARGAAKTPEAVAGSRGGGGVIDGWLVDIADQADVARVQAAGIACRAVPLMMTDLDATTRMAQEALELAEEVRGA